MLILLRAFAKPKENLLGTRLNKSNKYYCHSISTSKKKLFDG